MNAVQYIKNVGKSFGYVAIDTLKEYNPTISASISEAKSLSTDLYHFVKDAKSSVNDRMSKSEASLLQIGKDTVSDMWKNAKSDLMTGNFYNKARKDEAEAGVMESMMGFSMDDFNFDDDFGDFEFDDDMGSKSSGSDDLGVSAEVETQVRTTEAMIRTMDSVGSAVTGSINRTSVRTAEYIVAAQERSSRALYDLSNRGFKQVNVGLAAINANMNTLSTLVQPLTTHMQNSAAFYTNTSEYQKKTLELLGKIAENTAPVQVSGSSKAKKGTIGDLMSNGMLDLRAYAEYVGGNIKDYFSLITDMVGMMGGAKGASKMATASPISTAMSMALKGVMPKILKESMKDFNGMLEGLFQTMLGSAESKNWGIFEIIKELVLPTSTYKSKLNTSKYHKGKVDWDGKSRKALLDVIPRYLAEISSALTGQPMQIYDFEAGRYKTVAAIKKEWNQQYQDAANSAGSDLRANARNVLDSMVSSNRISSSQKDKMMSEIESYLLVALQSGNSDFINIMKDNFDHIKYGLSNDSVKLIRSIFKYADSHHNRSLRASTMGSIYTQRDSIGRRISDIEQSGDSVYNILFDEKPEHRSSVLLGTDKDGHDIFFYLKGIYENTMGGGKGRGRKRGGNRGPSGSGGSSSTSTSSSTSGFSDVDDTILDSFIEQSFSGERLRFPSRELEEYYYNKQANPNYPINDDLEEELKKWESINGFTRDAKNKVSNNPIVRKVMQTIGLAGDMLDKATKGISGVIDSAGKTLSEFVYGENGTIGLFETIKGLFTDFRGTLRSLFGSTKDKFLQSQFFADVKDNLRSAGSWIKNRFTGTAANGRRVTRSGMVSVSEGEMIIPAELNPFYHGKVNKRTQRRNEMRNAARFYGFYDEGGTIGGDDGVGTTSEESLQRTQEASVSFIAKILEKIFPKDAEGEAKKVQETVQKALDSLKGKGGAMGAGAAIGTGVSLITGGMISPILGAGLGAAAGLIVKSKEVQTLLFGDEEKDGVMGHHISEFVKKHLPDVATGSALGLAGGLFMGSPVLGAVLGGTIGYVKSSTNAKEFLFGSDELDSGLISKEFQTKFKQKLPKMALGAAAGLTFGPFGLAGNIILGSAVGYATDIEKSKKWLLGDPETGEKGFLEAAKENFFNPLVTIFDNLAESLRHTIRDTFHNLSKNISNFISNRMKKSKIAGAVGRTASRIGSKIYNFAGDTIGGTMNWLADRGTRKSLRRGYLIRDRKSKSGYLDAAGRRERRAELGMSESGMVAGFDDILANMETEEQYNEMLQGLQSMYKGTTGLNRSRSRYEKDTARNLESVGVDRATAREINKALHDRDYDTAMRLVNALPDSPTKNKIIGNIKAQRNYNSKIQGVEKSRTDLAHKLGVRPEELTDSQIANFMDLTRNEAKSRSLKTNEQVRQRNVEDAALKVPTLLEKILRALVDKNSHQELAASLGGSSSGANNGTPREGDNQERNGEAYEYRNGEWVNVEEESIKSKFMRTLTEHFPRIGSALEKVGGMFTNLKTKLFGDPNNEEDKGLFGNLFNKFFGEESLVGHFISFIAGSKVGKGIKTLLSKITLGNVMSNVVGPALLIGGFSGKFDELGNKFGFGKHDNSSTTATTKDGETVTLDPVTGQYKKADGTVVSASQIQTGSVKSRATDIANVSDRLKYNAGRGILTNTKSITSVVVSKTAPGKAITRAIASNGGAVNGIIDMVLDGLGKFTQGLRKVPMLSGLGDSLDNAILNVADVLTTKLTGSAAKSAASLAANAVIWVKIAFIAVDFTTGYEDAATTLGVKDPSIGERVICGILRTLKNCIPIVGTFIPDNVLVDIFAKYIGPFFGMDLEEFNARRSEAQADVDAYNSKHGTNMDWSEYNKSVRKDYTWTERIGNAGKGIWADTKNRFGSAKAGIKEKGLGGYLKDSISQMGTSFMDAYKAEGGGGAGLFAGMGSIFQKMLPGILGEVQKAKMDIRAKASQGDLKGLWSISLSDFSGGGVNEDGIETAVPSLFSKIIGQIPLILTKVTSTPFALISMLTKPIVNFAKETVDNIKSVFGIIQQQAQVGYDLAHNPDSDFSQLFDIPEIDAGPLSGIAKVAIVTSRIAGVGGAIFGKIGSIAGKWIGGVAEKIKGGWNNLTTINETIKETSNTGDLGTLWQTEMPDDGEGNPLGGFYKAALFGNKLIYSVPTIVKGVANTVTDWFTKKAEAIKTDSETFTEKLAELKDLSKEGTIGDIWKVEFTTSEENPIGGIFSFGHFIGKIFYTVGSVLNTILKPVKELMGDIKEGVTGLVEDAGEWVGEKWDGAKKVVGNAKDAVVTGAKNAWNTAGEWVENGWDSLTGWISGGSSGFVSQLDPRYSKMGIGNSTVGALGCGPASAVMALNQYSGNMANAVGLANNYQSAGGTDAAFFADYYARNGANASYYDGRSSAGRSNIINSISSGSPVVLMGRDSRNSSKANSPFGPNNHYVVASGFDGAGNLIINDPEARGTRKYSSKILNNVSLGIGINGGRSGLIRRLGIAAGGGGLRVDEITKAVWQFFKSKGYSEAAIAGIMGNLQQESGINPAALQKGGSAKGIAQWEGGRYTNLVNFAKSRNRDWTDLDSQLLFIDKELQGLDYYFSHDIAYGHGIAGSTLTNAGATPTTFAKWKKSTDVAMATRQFEGAFERAGKPHMDKRIQYAKYYYEQFTGKTFTYAPSIADYTGTSGVSSTSSSTGSSSVGSAVKGFGILSTITNAFNKIGDIFNGSSSEDSGVPMGTSTGNTDVYSSLPASAVGNGSAQSFIDIAKSQLGTIEGAGNRTEYGKFTGTDGQAWCAAFVSWCMNQAFGGNTNKLNKALRGGKSASVSTLWDQFKKAGAMSSTPQPGDIVIYKGNGASHTGLVESVNGNMITTIEGNTSGGPGFSGNGGMVARKNFDYTTNKRVTGFGRPDWEGASAAGSGLVPTASRRNQFRVVQQTGGSHVGSRRYVAGASGISKDTALMLKTIIALIEVLVKNTDKIDNIHDVLLSIAKAKGVADAATLSAIDKLSSGTDNASIEASLSGLKATVDTILAAG